MASAFERCGGFATVRRVVSAFYDRVLASPDLGRYFEKVDMRTLIDHQTKFVSFVMGGPTSVADRTLERAHASLGITRGEFAELTELLRDTLEEFDFGREDIEHVLEEVRRREHLIVRAG